jgi:hypothetical protein
MFSMTSTKSSRYYLFFYDARAGSKNLAHSIRSTGLINRLNPNKKQENSGKVEKLGEFGGETTWKFPGPRLLYTAMQYHIPHKEEMKTKKEAGTARTKPKTRASTSTTRSHQY